VTHLYEHDAALLLLRMGGGKTVITGAAIAELYRDGHITSCLVVAPKAVALHTWQHELQHWAELAHLTVSVALGSPAKRKAALLAPAQVHVITYDNLQWLRYALPERRWDLVVLDEVTRFNNGGKRWRAFYPVLQDARIRWGLTGSFCANSLAHAYYPVRAVDLGKTFGLTRDRFLRDHFIKGPFDWIPKGDAAEEIGRKAAHLVYQPDPVVYQSQLPDVVYQTHEFEMSPVSAEAYERLRAELVVELDGREITAASAGVLGNKLQQAASGFLYYENRDVAHLDDERMALLDELIREAGEPVLVWYWFAETAARLGERFRAPLLKDCLADWNKGKVPVALGHPRSVGHGVNAQAGGARMIWFEHTWSAEERAQAEARLHRQGQTRTVYVHDLLALCNGQPTVEHAMEAKRGGKISTADAVKKSLGVLAPRQDQPTEV
jgi:hypothetical protein